MFCMDTHSCHPMKWRESWSALICESHESEDYEQQTEHGWKMHDDAEPHSSWKQRMPDFSDCM